jgi:hypothetical protein
VAPCSNSNQLAGNETTAESRKVAFKELPADSDGASAEIHNDKYILFVFKAAFELYKQWAVI